MTLILFYFILFYFILFIYFILFCIRDLIRSCELLLYKVDDTLSEARSAQDSFNTYMQVTNLNMLKITNMKNLPNIGRHLQIDFRQSNLEELHLDKLVLD